MHTQRIRCLRLPAWALLLLLSVFTKSTVAQQTGYLLVQPSTENAKPDPTGASFTSDEELNNIFAEYGVTYYRLRFPGAKTSSIQNIHTVYATGNLDSLELYLKATEKFTVVEFAPFATINCSNPAPPVNDSLFANNVFSDWNLEMMGVRCAWNITMGDSNIVVAVADSEFDTAHADLNGKIFHLWDPAPSVPIFVHGTRVAGIITARTNNNVGIASVGNKIRVAGYRVPTTNGSGDPGTAVWQAFQDRRRIINVSWSIVGQNSPAVTEMVENGVVLVLSAGNSPGDTQHRNIAYIPGVITVSGIDSFGFIGGVSLARNQWVDVCAPAIHIPTTEPGGYVHC